MMKFTIVATLALAVLFGTFALPHTASANATGAFTPARQDNCVVIGSNAVPLRVRSTPGGRIIGKLKIGAHIRAWDVVTDRYGNDWTKISFGRGYGWVSTQFVSCG